MQHTPSTIIDALSAGPVGATLCFPSDRWPYFILGTSPSGKTARAERLRTVDMTTGHRPAYFNGDFPVWDHVYTDDELNSFRTNDAHVVTLRWSEKRQGWFDKGTPYFMGQARLKRDYSD